MVVSYTIVNPHTTIFGNNGLRPKILSDPWRGTRRRPLVRREKIDYARFRRMGLKIGSGPTESGCKSHARRLKGVGMRWTPAHAEAMMALESLYPSHLWPAYWKYRLHAA